MTRRDTKVTVICARKSETSSGRLTSSRLRAKITMMVDDATIAPSRTTSRRSAITVQCARSRYSPTSHETATQPNAKAMAGTIGSVPVLTCHRSRHSGPSTMADTATKRTSADTVSTAVKAILSTVT